VSTKQVRRDFLAYFHKAGHTVVPSSPVAPHDDPTLLFINAGMNQFKDVFLGKSRRDYARAATAQKCIRVGGKHNDLENVGHTARHLTFFEMLGNFSFGDYFKEEAIQFAWEVSTQVFRLDGDRIWVSVFREDDEAFELWTQYLPAQRIVRLGERDNFWAMGETGPCGPCSELLFDQGEEFGTAVSPYEDTEGDRFMEFWNLVFMQYNRDEQGTMAALPKRSIDTGMGIERLVALQSGLKTLFHTDVLKRLINQLAELCGRPYLGSAAAPYHVIADHLRSLSFAIADGVQPSNVDRGYVLRKILRRAVRYGRQLGMEKPFLAKLFPSLLDLMGEDYPELGESRNRIEEILTLEEEAFLRTLRRGGNLLTQVVEESRGAGNIISGDDAFKLKDTYGLPLEEILLIARDSYLTVDLERYQALEGEAKARSKARHKAVVQMAEENLFADFVRQAGESQFLGYAQVRAEGQIVGLLVDGKFAEEVRAGQECTVLLDRTPFYAEKGGQVADTGSLVARGVHFQVTDCQTPYPGVIAHLGLLKAGHLHLGDRVEAQVDEQRRHRIANNHTATHLLHWALQEVLGPHVKQAGSVVDADRLRFDFTHHKAMTQEEIRAVEDLVNGKVRANLPVQSYEISYAQAQKQRQIKQFFGEKYGDVVRVVDVEFSKELCGGTHTSQTGNIGYFRILKESSVAAGTRRLEAVTGVEATAADRANQDILEEVARILGAPSAKLLEAASRLTEEHTHYAREMKAAKQMQVRETARQLATHAKAANAAAYVVARIEGLESLRETADQVLDRLKQGVVVLGAAEGHRCALCVKSNVSSLHAGHLIRDLAPLIGGGGGGRAEMAQAGGKAPEKLDEALDAARSRVEASLR
jgi:alanyl-tRNA synthetase